MSLHIQEYRFPDSLEEAALLLEKSRRNVILGGCGWLKMGNKPIGTAIDLSRLGLDEVKETQESVSAGAMVTLRQLETMEVFRREWGGLLPRAVEGIVGVQFRGMATVGGTVYSRFGFSDVLTALMVLDCRVRLYRGGEVPLEEYAARPRERDILVEVILRRDGRKTAWQTFRNTATDFPVLSVALSRGLSESRIAVGARPGRAALAREASRLLGEGASPEAVADAAAEELAFGTNLRASGWFRQDLCRTLVARGVRQLEGGERV